MLRSIHGIEAVQKACRSLHVVLELLKVLVLLCKPLLQLQKLLFLSHADGVVLVRFLTLVEGIGTVK
jgi:hypothetical protein